MQPEISMEPLGWVGTAAVSKTMAAVSCLRWTRAAKGPGFIHSVHVYVSDRRWIPEPGLGQRRCWKSLWHGGRWWRPLVSRLCKLRSGVQDYALMPPRHRPGVEQAPRLPVDKSPSHSRRVLSEIAVIDSCR